MARRPGHILAKQVTALFTTHQDLCALCCAQITLNPSNVRFSFARIPEGGVPPLFTPRTRIAARRRPAPPTRRRRAPGGSPGGGCEAAATFYATGFLPTALPLAPLVNVALFWFPFASPGGGRGGLLQNFRPAPCPHPARAVPWLLPIASALPDRAVPLALNSIPRSPPSPLFPLFTLSLPPSLSLALALAPSLSLSLQLSLSPTHVLSHTCIRTRVHKYIHHACSCARTSPRRSHTRTSPHRACSITRSRALRERAGPSVAHRGGRCAAAVAAARQT